jgi:hypothetical protein
MDELLALMEDNPTEEEEEEATIPVSGMDELAALMTEEPDAPPSSSPGPPTYSRHSSLVTPPSTVKSKNKKRSSQPKQNQPSNHSKSNPPVNPPVSVSVDDRLGIRMLNRIVSSIDLLDMTFSSGNPYHSPATLSAMSLSALTRILVDPPQVVDRATVCGKTSCVTVGVVFSNSGTRISQKGGAFCILTIGSFTSGPCLSVLLFGAVYSQFCRSCGPGKVVALVNPKLLPPKNDGRDDNNTSISMTVYDTSQLVLVATARDYGVCKATVRVKQPDGSWTGTGHCKNYVDKRKCEYCDSHRKQKYAAESTSNMRVMGSSAALPSNNNNMTYMQKMRAQAGAKVQSRNAQGNNRLVVNQKQQHSNVQGNNRLLHQKQHSTTTTNRFLNPTANNSASSTTTTTTTFDRPSTSTANQGLGQTIPMHMKKMEPLVTKSASMMARKGNSSSNRLLNGTRKAPSAGPENQPPKTKRKLGIIGGGNWLQTETAKKKPVLSSLAQMVKKKQRSINTVGTGGFDGSVIVPKPSGIFANKAPMMLANTGTSGIPNDEPSRDKILQQQSEVAQRLKERRAGAPANPYKTPTSQPKTKGSFLDSIEIDQDKVLNAKSRFANEAAAEDYAHSRLRITELEKLESNKGKKQQSKDNNKKDQKNNRLTKEWNCSTCGARFTARPMQCITANHLVKISRTLAKVITKTDKRTKMHEKSVEEGGLRLGAGLDWSRPWSRFG